MKTWSFSLLVASSLYAEIIPSDRVIVWTPGVLGGIPALTNGPSVMDYGAVADGVTDCSSAVTNALAHCPITAAVYFPAGTYFLLTNILIGKDGTYKWGVFRGAGIGKTIIRSGTSNAWPAAIYFCGSTTFTGSNELASGYSKGSNVVEAVSTTGLTNGMHVEIGQANDPGVVFGNLEDANALYQVQGNQITNISGTTISLLRPLHVSLAASNNPWIRAFAFSTSVTNCGVEGMTVNTDQSSALRAVEFRYAMDCWAKNVEATNFITTGITIERGYRCEVRGCIVRTSRATGSSKYCIQLSGSTTDSLIEDNIVGVSSAGVLVQGGANGNVVGYNFCTEGYTTSCLLFSVQYHGGSWQNLTEGNVCNGVFACDITWGANWNNTFSRNWATCYSYPVPTGCRQGFRFDRTNWYNSAVGNLTCRPADFGVTGTNPDPWDVASYPDTNVVLTTLRHGNFNFKTNTIEWDGSIPDQTIPSSYYLDGKPTWFERLQWPPIGPDVAASTNTTVTNIALIPAQARWLGIDYILRKAFVNSARVGTIRSP